MSELLSDNYMVSGVKKQRISALFNLITLMNLTNQKNKLPYFTISDPNLRVLVDTRSTKSFIRPSLAKKTLQQSHSPWSLWKRVHLNWRVQFMERGGTTEDLFSIYKKKKKVKPVVRRNIIIVSMMVMVLPTMLGKLIDPTRKGKSRLDMFAFQKWKCGKRKKRCNVSIMQHIVTN